jgi:amino acid permease
VALLVSFLSFLTAIWSPGAAFAWLVNLGTISTLLVWISIGATSLRFRAAWRAQGRTLADLPYKQPLFPLLPVVVLVLGIVMFAAEGYGAVTSGGGAKVVCVSLVSTISTNTRPIEHRCDIHRPRGLCLSLRRLHDPPVLQDAANTAFCTSARG